MKFPLNAGEMLPVACQPSKLNGGVRASVPVLMKARLQKDVQLYPGVVMRRGQIVYIEANDDGEVYIIGYKNRKLKEDEYNPHLSWFDFDRLIKGG